MSFICLNEKFLPLSQITKHQPSSIFEEEVIGFIEDWQNGQETFLQQTSGSTGKPKLIELTRAQMMASALLTIDKLELKPDQNSLLCLSPAYIGGKMMIVRSIINKMNLIAIEPSANPFLNLQHSIDFAALTPMQMQMALSDNESRKYAQRIKKVILGGGAVSRSLSQLIDELLDGDCYSTYGMTETSSHIALKKLNGPNKSRYFTCFDDIEINQDHRDCLTINGAVTNFETIITNDRVNLISSNQFEWLGRVDNVINTGGIKVQSEKVEQLIEGYFQENKIENRFFVAGIPDELLGEKIVLLIEKTEKKLSENLLRNLKELLPSYHVPKEMIIKENFTETPTGKINRKATLNAAI